MFLFQIVGDLLTCENSLLNRVLFEYNYSLAVFCQTQNVTNNEWWLYFEEFVSFFSQSAVFLAALLSAAQAEYRVSSRREESWNMEPDSSWRWCHSCVLLHLQTCKCAPRKKKKAREKKEKRQTLHVWPSHYYIHTTRSVCKWYVLLSLDKNNKYSKVSNICKPKFISSWKMFWDKQG